MHTLVIAATYETAESVMKFFALKDPAFLKVPLMYVPRQPGVLEPDQFRSRYSYVSAGNAMFELQGSSYETIVIAGDYVRWGYTGMRWHAGDLTRLWQEIKVRQARGARVVWA